MCLIIHFPSDGKVCLSDISIGVLLDSLTQLVK